MNSPSSDQPGVRPRMTFATMGVYALLAVAAVLLWRDHRAHVVSLLPYLFLAACPLMHLLGHRRHGGRQQDSSGHDHHA